jgi:NAD dependent epimerase/dehydratase family enzyme
MRKGLFLFGASNRISSSESKSSTNTATEEVRSLIAWVRMPISAPLEHSSNGMRSSGVALSLGSTVMTDGGLLTRMLTPFEYGLGARSGCPGSNATISFA